jgi:hypothetical protein
MSNDNILSTNAGNPVPDNQNSKTWAQMARRCRDVSSPKQKARSA